jgi:hypothetical protein
MEMFNYTISNRNSYSCLSWSEVYEKETKSLFSISCVFPFSLQNFIISNSKAFDNEIQMRVHRISFNTISSKTRHNIKRNLKESQWKKALIFPMFFSNPETIFTSNLPFCFINSKSYAPVDFTFHDFIVDNLRNWKTGHMKIPRGKVSHGQRILIGPPLHYFLGFTIFPCTTVEMYACENCCSQLYIRRILALLKRKWQS